MLSLVRRALKKPSLELLKYRGFGDSLVRKSLSQIDKYLSSVWLTDCMHNTLLAVNFRLVVWLHKSRSLLDHLIIVVPNQYIFKACNTNNT